MKILRFLFYKFFCFYNKRWPKHDPEIYASMLLSGILYYSIMLLSVTVIEIFGLIIENPQKYYFYQFPIFLPIWYFLFIWKDRYIKFLNHKDYDRWWFRGWRASLIIILFFLLPVVVTIFATKIRSNN